MSKKKMFFAIASTLVMMMFMIMPNKAEAAETPLSPSVYFGINEFREPNAGETDSMGYAIKSPKNDDINNLNGAMIWQIQKYQNASSTTGFRGNYYCVRAGYGFSNTSNTGDKEEYNISYDLKTDKDLIASSNSIMNIMLNNGYYNNLLALTDLLYLPGVSTEAEKKALFERAGINESKYTYKLTDNDIEAVQQAAIWYYTNHDESTFANIFDNYDSQYETNNSFETLTKTSWLSYRLTDSGEYGSLSNYGLTQTNGQSGPGIDRNEQAVLLYNYLIMTANANASAYESGTAVSNTKITLYLNKTNTTDAQPIVLIERTQPKEFDLALRKYITKVGETTLSGDESRVPNIDRSTIESDTTTAIYKHRKDPIKVSNGSKITYNITVYNEGEKAGRATKIVDQLPTGLTSNLVTGSKVTSTKGNEYTVTYDTNTNKVIFETTGTNNLNAYDGNTLDSDTIQIECTVTAEQDSNSEKILTNVAWISEEYDAVANLTITNQEGKDRDSEPSTVPNVNQGNMANYAGKDNKGDLSDSSYFYKGQQDDDDFEKVKLEKLGEGSYNLVLVKEDANGEQLNSKATFDVNGEAKEVTGRLQIVTDKKINSDNYTQVDTYTIKETKAPDAYCEFKGIIKVNVTKKFENGTYKVDKVEYTVTDENGNDIKDKTSGDLKVYFNENGNIYVEVKNYQFDLKLIKRIAEVNGTKVPERLLGVDITDLASGKDTTATYKMDKNPVAVKKGDIVKYTLRVYNEGSVDGYAKEVSENIPQGLEFVWSEKTGTELDSDTTLSDEEKEAIKYNQGIWDIKTVNKDTKRVEMITTDYLAKGKGAEIKTENANLIKAFNTKKEYVNTVNEKNPDYKEVSVYMKVVSEDAAGTIIRNEAAVTNDSDANGNDVTDRDSTPEEWKKENSDKYYDEDKKWAVYKEDEEDYDNVVLQSFDLALRKFIVAVSKDDKIEDAEYLKDEDGTYTRAPKVDTSKLNTTDENGKLITTAIYNHTKKPVEVCVNDVVVYMLRVYNEGEIDGYASEIKDYLPPYLEFVDGDFNKEYGWKVSEDGRTVTTSYLDKSLIEKTTKNDKGEIVLSYKEVPIMCKVKSDAKGKLTNIAEITEYKDENKKEITDRDSQSNNVVIPSDEELPNYKDNETGDYIPGQQDDDDFEKVTVTKFDLALRKWVTHAIVVENGKETVTQTGHKAEDDPEQVVKVELNRKKLDKLTVKFKYSIRVTNEGDLAGYVKEITDYVPQGLKFVAEDNPDWKDEGNNVISTKQLENTLLQPGQSAEVQVTLTWINGKDNLGLKTNVAEISEDYNEKHAHDIDSTPDNKVEGEDDIDDAPVLLSISTGNAKMYISLGFIVLVTIAGGIVLIKKFVL